MVLLFICFALSISSVEADVLLLQESHTVIFLKPYIATNASLLPNKNEHFSLELEKQTVF